MFHVAMKEDIKLSYTYVINRFSKALVPVPPASNPFHLIACISDNRICLICYWKSSERSICINTIIHRHIHVITNFGHFLLKRQIFGRIVIWLFAHTLRADISRRAGCLISVEPKRPMQPSILQRKVGVLMN